MSNNTDYQQGQNDAQQGKGPKSTNGMPSQARESYEAGYQNSQQQK